MRIVIDLHVGAGGLHLRETVPLSLNDVAQMLADDPVGMASVLNRIGTGAIASSNEADGAADLIEAMKPALCIACEKANHVWQEMVEAAERARRA